MEGKDPAVNLSDAVEALVDDDMLVGTVDRVAELDRAPFYRRASEQHLAPLWRVLGGLVTETPRSAAAVAHWRYAGVRPYLMEACEIISTKESERRVLVLENRLVCISIVLVVHSLLLGRAPAVVVPVQ